MNIFFINVNLQKKEDPIIQQIPMPGFFENEQVKEILSKMQETDLNC